VTLFHPHDHKRPASVTPKSHRQIRSLLNFRNRLNLILASATFLVTTSFGASFPTSFTYQGRLTYLGLRTDGQYDFTFAVFDSPAAGVQVGSVLTNSAVSVTNGIFTVALDFGGAVFNGDQRWLEIAVRQSTNDFTILAPRQAVTAIPYSIAAASLIGPLPASQLPPFVSRLDANQTFTGSNAFSGPAVFAGSSNFFTGAFSGDATALTNVLSTAISRPLLTASGAGTNLFVDFSTDAVQLTASSNFVFLQSTNRAPSGRYAECVWYLQGGQTNRSLWFNTNWIPVGTLATNNPICWPATNSSSSRSPRVGWTKPTSAMPSPGRNEQNSE
jgi:hypothetical protein